MEYTMGNRSFYDIRYFYPNEEITFKVEFNYENVQTARIELVNKK